jgi:tetratricopeptide (TPR) repeat protein
LKISLTSAAFAALLVLSTYRLYKWHSVKVDSKNFLTFNIDDSELTIRQVGVEPQTTRDDAAAEALQELASLAFDQRDFTQATTLLRRALAIREQAQGPEHLDVAGVLQRLGASLRQLGDLAEAEPLLKRALAICATCSTPIRRTVSP